MKSAELTYLNEALVRAVRCGHINIVRELIRLGADVHWEKEMALREAARHGHEDVAKVLKCGGAKIEEALWTAAHLDDAKTVENLLRWAAHTRVGVMLLDAKAAIRDQPAFPDRPGSAPHPN